MMAIIGSNMSGHIQKQLTRSLERILEEAHLSGELKLSGRKLKDFPKVVMTDSKYSLCDIVIADLSKNRFGELPEEVTGFSFLEKLHLYHNAIRVIPETVVMLQSLSYLDLSRNQLISLPREVCRLPLQILLAAYNRLTSLPEELGRMTALTELDVGCNEIASLPSRIGDLPRIRNLDLRSNLLVHLPIELTYLRLVKLDISGNRISVLPNEFRKMKTLVDLKVTDNPLTSPPASLCIRGRVHIFKYLERQAAKHERTRTGRLRRNLLDSRGHVTLDMRSHRRINVDSGYNTSDGVDKRWSQDINHELCDGDVRKGWRNECSPLAITVPNEMCTIGSFSGTSTPSTISPGENTHSEVELHTVADFIGEVHNRRLEGSSSEGGAGPRNFAAPALHNNSIISPGHLDSSMLDQTSSLMSSNRSTDSTMASSHSNGNKKKILNHTQTYKEYKEALRQQRATESSNIYRPREQILSLNNESFLEDIDFDISKDGDFAEKELFAGDHEVERLVLPRTASENNQKSWTLMRNTNDCNLKSGKDLEQPHKKSTKPSQLPSDLLSNNSSPRHKSRSARSEVDYVENPNNTLYRNSINPKMGKSTIWNSNIPEKYSFTMRREFERAKEEADLIEQLRSNIETRLKMALPEDLAPALIDGVVLCHLANHVKPRSVGSIHVPSPAVPKLTMARCRRNVDNFLEACRKIGVDENLLCCASDVLEGGRGVVRVAVTVAELLRFQRTRSPTQDLSLQTINYMLV